MSDCNLKNPNDVAFDEKSRRTNESIWTYI